MSSPDFVRLLAFTAEKEVLSVAEDGRVLRWDVNQEEGKHQISR